MPTPPPSEAQAIARLIAQIDALDRLRDQVGRRVIAAFLIVFAAALALLLYVAVYAGPPRVNAAPPGPRVPGVLQRAPR